MKKRAGEGNAMKEEETRASLGIEGARRATEIPRDGTSPEGSPGGVEGEVAPDPEVPTKPVRRHYNVEYKLRILKLADACTERGSLGALLRREGVYASTINTWRRQRDRGVLGALTPKKRGRKGSDRNPLVLEMEKLRKENARLAERLRKAEIIIDVQKKISMVLGISPAITEEDGND